MAILLVVVGPDSVGARNHGKRTHLGKRRRRLELAEGDTCTGLCGEGLLCMCEHGRRLQEVVPEVVPKNTTMPELPVNSTSIGRRLFGAPQSDVTPCICTRETSPPPPPPQVPPPFTPPPVSPPPADPSFCVSGVRFHADMEALTTDSKLQDISGNHHHGTFHMSSGSASDALSATGGPAGGGSLNMANVQYIELPADDAVILPGAVARSVCFWTKGTSSNYQACISTTSSPHTTLSIVS